MKSRIKTLILLLNHERIGYVEIAFKVVYLLHLLMAFNVYMTGQAYLKFSVALVVLLGGFLLLCRACHVRLYLRTPGIILLGLFAVSFLIPSVLIYRYDLFSSLKTAMWMILHFCLLFCFSTEKTENAVKREFWIVGLALLAFVTVENVASLWMLVTEYCKPYETPDGTAFLAGLMPWGRLYGVHTDPNYACVYTLAAILFAVYMIKKCKRWFLRLAFALLAVINFAFVVMTVSRTGVVCAAVGAATYALLWSLKKWNKWVVLRSVVLSVGIAAAVIGVRTAMISGYNAVNTWLAEDVDPSTPSKGTENDATTPPADSEGEALPPPSGGEVDEPVVDTPNEEKAPPVEIGRTEEELDGDISNRRFDIWKSGWDIFKKNPVFGIGFENVLGYANDLMPDTYIVNNDHADFDAFHSFLVDVLVSQGIVGILILLLLVLRYFGAFFKYYFKLSESCRDEAVLCIAICVMTLASALFLSHVFYVNCPTTYIFWAYAGYLTYFLVKAKKTRFPLPNEGEITPDCGISVSNAAEDASAELVSVIVPVYNAEAFLARCVDSILAQSYGKLELLLIDDGSADGSPRMCDAYAERDARVKVIHKQNQGPAETRNVGLEQAVGELIVFVDSDDWIPRDYIEILRSALLREGADMSVSDMWITDGKTYESINRAQSGELVMDSESTVQTLLLQKEFDTGPHCKMYRKELFDGRRFPDGVLLFEDFDLLFRIALACRRVVYTPAAKYYYYQNTESIMHRSMSERHLAVLSVSERMLSSVTERYPQLEKAAYRRHLETIFFLLDKILYSKSESVYGNTVQEIKRFLRGSFGQVIFNRHIKMFSKLKVLALLIGFPLYGTLVRLKDLAVGNH